MNIKHLALLVIFSFTTLNSIKVSIIGSPGSGKSTFAKELQKHLGAPIYHLDHYYWKPNWKRKNIEEFLKIHKELCDEEEWIIEGIFSDHQFVNALEYQFSKADYIIFFDLPPYLCVLRILKRFFLNLGKDITAPGCPQKFDLPFLFVVANFNKTYKPKFANVLNKYESTKKIFVIKSEHDRENVIEFLISNYR